MSRGTQNTVLLLIGLSAVVMVIKGTYLHFVRPALLPSWGFINIWWMIRGIVPSRSATIASPISAIEASSCS